MVQQQLYSLFHVQIAMIKMKLKIIYFIDKTIVLISLDNADFSQQIFIGFTFQSNFVILLPAGHNNIIVHIHDKLNSITKCNMSTVYVDFNSGEINFTITDYFLIKLLSRGNQNSEKVNRFLYFFN
jgi:hypothetical protein